MHDIQELREKLMNELCEYADRNKLDGTALSTIDTLAHSIKNIDKIAEDGYSGARRRDSMGRYVGDYQNRYSMDYNDSYSGYNSRGGYSMNDNIKQDLKDIMNSADEHTKQKLQRIISQM